VIELVKLGICTPAQGAALLGLSSPEVAAQTAPPVAEAAPIAPPVAAPNTVAPPTEKTLRTLPVRMEVLDIPQKFVTMTPEEALPVYLAVSRQEAVDFDRAMSAVKVIKGLNPEQIHALLEAAEEAPISTAAAVSKPDQVAVAASGDPEEEPAVNPVQVVAEEATSVYDPVGAARRRAFLDISDLLISGEEEIPF
jgi:hypothetical protein